MAAGFLVMFMVLWIVDFITARHCKLLVACDFLLLLQWAGVWRLLGSGNFWEACNVTELEGGETATTELANAPQPAWMSAIRQPARKASPGENERWSPNSWL